jgi:bisanhydrobacterioruberin hydratase
MIENIRKHPVLATVVIAIYYTVGVFGLSLEKTRPLFQDLIPFTLLLSLFFLWLFHEKSGMRIYLGWLIIFLLGFFIEVLGVNTGIIFGHYAYGKSLGFKVLETPVIIGVNWLLLVYSCWALVGLLTANRWLGALAGGFFMVIYDIALEPVAIRLDMWSWNLSHVPVQNYVAWFIISFLFFLIFNFFNGRDRNKLAPSLFIIQVMFFVILNIIFYFD